MLPLRCSRRRTRSNLAGRLQTLETKALLASFYVNGGTGAAGNPGTAEAPFRTIRDGVAAAMANPGDDEVVIEPFTGRTTVGVYFETIPLVVGYSPEQFLGFPSANGGIVIRGATGNAADVVIDPPSTYAFGIDIPFPVTIQDLTISGSSAHGILNRSTAPVVVDNLRIINNPSGSGILSVDGDTTVRNTFLSGNYQGMWVGSEGNVSTAASLTVENTVSQNNTFHGIVAKVTGTITLKNYSGLSNPLSGFNSYGGSHVIIEGGEFRNNGRNGIRLDGAGGVDISGVHVAGNGNVNHQDQIGGGGLQIIPASSLPISIRNATLIDNETQGSGGGLEVWSTNSNYHPAITISDSVISFNQTSRIAQTSRRGGGISIVGWADVTVERSTIRNNLSYLGGGVHAYLYFDSNTGIGSRLKVVDSAVFGNEADTTAGGITVYGGDFQLLSSTVSDNTVGTGAGGVSAASRTGLMVNSTISGNSATIGQLNGTVNAGGVISQPNDSFQIVNSTIAFNSGLNVGGLYSSGPATTVANTLIAANVHLSNQLWEDGGVDTYGEVLSHGGNLVGELIRTWGFNASTDLTGTTTAPLDARLGPLQDNGGLTQTHALQPGSPAINAGLNSIVGLTVPELDQRGIQRPRGFSVDIGSFESGPLPDLRMDSVVLNGSSTLTVNYTILDNDAPIFDLTFLKSADLVVEPADELLETITISDPALRTVGSHTIQLTIGSAVGQVSLPGTDTPDDESEYELLVVINRSNTVIESDSDLLEDNVARLTGLYQINSAVFVYGDDNNESYVATRVGTTQYRITRNGVIVGSWPQSSVNTFRFRGGAGNDTLSISNIAVPALLIGGQGDDSLTGGTLSDVLIGGAGNDSLIGGTGNDGYRFDVDLLLGSDTITDSGGIDLLDFSQTEFHNITVNLGLITSQTVADGRLLLTLTSSSSIDQVTGGHGNDLITGNSLANVLNGGSGDDSISGLGGNDTINGGSGNDTLDGGANNDTFLFNADTDGGSDFLVDAAGTDTISFENSTADVVFSLGLAGLQAVNGGLLLVTLASASIIENITGGAGNDILTGNTLANVLIGGPGDDLLSGANGNDTYLFVANNLLGSDTLTDSVGTETISFAGTMSGVEFTLGLTSLQVVNANVSVTLSAVTFDNLIGGFGDDHLTGSTGNNVITGGGGDDMLAGSTGSDTYLFDADLPLGIDTIIETGSGVDTIDLSATTTSSVVVDLSTTTVQIVNANLSLILQTASIIEAVRGGSQNDVLTGNSLANTLTGNAGNDTLIGLNGNDLLIGGAGNDTLDGGAGDDQYQFDTDSQLGMDTVLDAAGVDAIDFTLSTTRSVIVDLSVTTSQIINSNLTLVIPEELEIVLGSALNDTIRGNALANVLIGNAGNDTLEGRGGNDILVGGLGADVLNGGSEQDVLIAGRTSYDSNLASFRTLSAAWNSPDPYNTRVNSLRLGVGSPVVKLKAKSTVLNDTLAVDQLSGSTEEDWFFAALDDVLTDLTVGEFVDAL
ncbi:MAG: right-handed parallel beta-helix repeat-containing protein [Planctomyces sp.]|nr:right-handed parallel beta-helix repeat-containing protein [Planctomyces sp.]